MSVADSANVGADKHPDFAVVWSFFSKFGKQLELENVSIQDVSKWITNKCSESSHTVDVMVKLMRKTGMRVDKQRWQKFLLKATAKQDPQLAMEMSATGFDGISHAKKLRILKILCEMQFDDNIKFKTQINNENPEEQRLKPVGKNEDGCLYWYQQDEDFNVRIYIEDQDDDDDETGWKVACRTKDEIEDLIKRLSNETTGEKLDNSDNDDDDVVETKFQKFLKNQCNAESESEDEKTSVSHGETKRSEKECNEENINPKSDDSAQCIQVVDNCEQSNLPNIARFDDNLPNHEEELKSSSVVITKLPGHVSQDDEVNKSVIKIQNKNSSCTEYNSKQTKTNSCHHEKSVELDSKVSLANVPEKSKTELVLNDHDKSTKTTSLSNSDTSQVDFGKAVVKLENIMNKASSEKSVGPIVDVKSEHIVNGNESIDITSSDHLQTLNKQETKSNTSDAEVLQSKKDGCNVLYQNNGSLHKLSEELPHECPVKAAEGSDDKYQSANIQDDATDTIETEPAPCHNLGESTPHPGTEESDNLQAEKNQENGSCNSEEEHSPKESNTPKKKKRRRRAPVSRRRSRSSKQNSRPKSTTPRQQNKPKLSRIELLQKEAESIIQKEREEKEAKDSSYRTRSGRRVKSTKHDQNESDVWQSIPDVIAAKNEDANDKDFQYTEGKSRNTTKSDVEVMPKKPRRSRKNDLPCEKCGLFSHPTTILLCDECNKGHHMACLTPPLMAVPEDDWFCPKCCKEKLIANLKEIFENLETKIKLNERKMRQTERNKILKEYTGISTTNIIATKPRPHKPVKRKKSYSSDSEDDLKEFDSLSESSSSELKSVRSCRTKKVTYDFSSFDKTIRDALGEVEEPDSSDEKPISGKDIRTIVAAEKGEEAAKKFALEDAAARRKKRNLTDLNFSEEEVAESGSNYSVSSSEGEASEEEFMGSEDLDSDGSFKIGLLRRSRRKKKRVETKPVKRSKRLRRKRIQEDYASDLSDSSTEYEEDAPKKRKRRTRVTESSEDEYQPPKVKPKNFVDDDEEEEDGDDDEEEDGDDEDNEVKEEPKKKNRVLHSSSEGMTSYTADMEPNDLEKESSPSTCLSAIPCQLNRNSTEQSSITRQKTKKDETKEENESTETPQTATPHQQKDAPKQNEKAPAASKQDEEVSSDDWSSLSSNAEESFEDDLSTEEAVPK